MDSKGRKRVYINSPADGPNGKRRKIQGVADLLKLHAQGKFLDLDVSHFTAKGFTKPTVAVNPVSSEPPLPATEPVEPEPEPEFGTAASSSSTSTGDSLLDTKRKNLEQFQQRLDRRMSGTAPDHTALLHQAAKDLKTFRDNMDISKEMA